MEAKLVELDGMQFYVRPLPGMAALKLLPRLTRDFGPVLASLYANDVPGAMKALTEKMTETELEQLTRLLLESATIVVNGSEMPLMPSFDLHMAGKADTTVMLLWAALEVSAPGFFQKIRAAFGDLGAKAKRGFASTLGGMPPKSGPASGS